MIQKQMRAFGALILFLSSLAEAVTCHRALQGSTVRRQQQVIDMLEIVRGNRSVLSFQLNSGLQVKGALSEVRKSQQGQVIFLKWEGETEMLNRDRLIQGQGRDRHASGFSSPLGPIQTQGGLKRLSSVTSRESLSQFGLVMNEKAELKYESGILVRGVLKDAIFSVDGKLIMLTFDDATVIHNKDVLYDPSWGAFDLAVGESVESIKR